MMEIFVFDSKTKRCFKHQVVGSKCLDVSALKDEFNKEFGYPTDCQHYFTILSNKMTPLSSEKRDKQLTDGEFLCLYYLPPKSDANAKRSEFATWMQKSKEAIHLLEYAGSPNSGILCGSCTNKAVRFCQSCNQQRNLCNYCDECFTKSHITDPNCQNHRTVRLLDDDQEPPQPPAPVPQQATRGGAAALPAGDNGTAGQPVGWACTFCNCLNLPLRRLCKACETSRPDGYIIPADYQLTEEEELIQAQDVANDIMLQEFLEQDQASQNIFGELQQAEEAPVNANIEAFECSICFTDIEVGEGVMLKSCLHSFCRDCLIGQINSCEDAVVKCPFRENDNICDEPIQEREINELCPEHMPKLLGRSLQIAESQILNSFHCKTVDCPGWCEYEDDVNFFNCPICGKQNCLTCRVIHEGMDCKEYQDDLKLKVQNDADAKATLERIEAMIANKEAMRCPRCQVVIMKKDGCDWLMCSVCQMEICWITQQARWGPGGHGDNTGGCKCGVNGRMCHPQCTTCH